MRPKLDWRTASKDNYKLFCETHPKSTITFKQYKEILYTFNECLYTYILESGNKLKLPWGLGTLTICKYKRPRKKMNKAGDKEIVALSIDWKKTKEAGKYIYHMNYDTEGYNFYWHWNSRESRIKFSFIWKFEMCRKPRRMLPIYLRNKEKDYKNLYKMWVIK